MLPLNMSQKDFKQVLEKVWLKEEINLLFYLYSFKYLNGELIKKKVT